MKKISVFLFLLFTFCSLIFCQPDEGFVSIYEDENVSSPVPSEKILSSEVPELLKGIWQGKDRLIMFSQKNEFAIQFFGKAKGPVARSF